MKNGRRTCEVLKEVRRKVAQENNIALTERECTFEGDCRGTCPYCEAEVRYLERELQRRKALGRAVAVAGLAVSSMMMGYGQSVTPQAPTATSLPPTTNDSIIIDGNGEWEPVGIVVADVDLPSPQQWHPDISGTPTQYLKERLTVPRSVLRNRTIERTYIVLIINEDGEVKEVVFQPKNDSPGEEEKAFYEDVTRILKAMPKWVGGHSAASYEIAVRELW